MRSFFVLLLGLWLPVAVKAGETIPLEATKISALGIQFVEPQPVTEVPLGVVPAAVTVPPDAEVMVSAPLPGLIEEVRVVEGEPVGAGQIVARLNSPELLIHQQQLLDAWQDRAVAEAKYRREKMLFSEGIIAKSRWLDTKKTWRQARTAYEQARGELASLGMGPAAIGKLLKTRRLDSRLDLVARRAGVITDRRVTPGQRVDKLAPLMVVTDTSQLWISMNVPVALAVQLQPGTKVRPEATEAWGAVFLIAGTVDSATQTVLVRARLEQPAGLRPGRKINVRLVAPVRQPILKLPNDAVVTHQGKHYVFVRKAAGFEIRAVTLAAAGEAGAVFIEQGLEPSEQVASQGVAALKAAWLGEE